MAHFHNEENQSGKNLKIAFFLNLAFTTIEIIGGFYVNSVAILSDALHDLGDSISLAISWYLNHKSKKGRTEKFSFGYTRFSLLGALINSVVLMAGGTYIIYEAITRILEPEPSDALGMVIFAIGGVAVNGYAAWRLRSGKTLNERVISLHLLEDVLGWVAVLVVAIVLLFTDIHVLDPILSLLITLYVLWNVLKRLKDTFVIFLQGVPENVSVDVLEDKIGRLDYVDSLHHTHIWSLEGEHHVFTTHVVLKNIDKFDQIIKTKEKIKGILEKYPFTHYTIETELDEETCKLKDHG